ncbi:MAG: hypothetical protein E4G98_01230 [Promethearchaeota archaeon]|nr:MAG: hypothetical protein E4G98_01230 [Candidatus Lokiarchaeota archaeon]
MHNNKKSKILGFLIIGVCFAGVFLSQIGLASADPSQSDLDQLYLDDKIHLYGDGIKNPINVSHSALLNETYTTFLNISYLFLNRVNTTYNLKISGVSLANILQTHDILQDNATYVQFVGNDGAKSFYLPLRIILADVQNVLIVTEEDGGAPDDGPLKIAVFLDAIVNDTEMIQYFHENCAPGEDFVHNSKYAWKWLTAIHITTQDSILQTDTDDENISSSIMGFPSLVIIMLGSTVVLMQKYRTLEENT